MSGTVSRAGLSSACASLALLAACSPATSEVVPTSAHFIERVQRARVEGHSERFRGLMSEHFGFAAWARDSTSIGDTEAARTALLDLANYAYNDVVPGAWLPRVRALQEDARTFSQARSVDALAGGVARLGRMCGDCHAATQGGPAVSPVAPEPASSGRDTFPDRMFRHRRAIELLWVGLVAPSASLWNQGASLLTRASSELDARGELPAGFDAALVNLRYLGERAAYASSPLDREQSYARVLGACANCHRAAWNETYE